MPNKLVIGVDGLVGRSVHAAYARKYPEGEVYGTTRRVKNVQSNVWFLDLAQPVKLPDEFASGVVVVSAAISTFDACLKNPVSARAVNVDAVEAIASQVQECGGYVLMLSTSCVFNGSISLPDEQHDAQPSTFYGKLKRESELRLLDISNGEFGILRLTKILDDKASILHSWLRGLNNGIPVHPASDLLCAPVNLDTVVDAILNLTKKKIGGIWHLSPPDELTYAQMAMLMAHCWRQDVSLVQPRCLSELGVQLECTPKFAALDATKLSSTFDMKISQSRDLVIKFADRIAEANLI